MRRKWTSSSPKSRKNVAPGRKSDGSFPQAGCTPHVKKQALSVFERIATAEGNVHGQNPATVSFHEVGAIDALVDIVGGLLGCHELGVKTFSATPVNVGSGTIDSAHGVLPVPGPCGCRIGKRTPHLFPRPCHGIDHSYRDGLADHPDSNLWPASACCARFRRVRGRHGQSSTTGRTCCACFLPLLPLSRRARVSKRTRSSSWKPTSTT